MHEDRYIRSVSVEGLFGRYDYTVSDNDGDALKRLVMLYGGNGTGKTTLLRLIYHALSARQGRGHKGFLARTPFRSLLIKLGNGSEVAVTKEQLQGDLLFECKMAHGGRVSAKFAATPGDDGQLGVLAKAVRQPDPLLVEAALREMAPTMFFLGDDRTIESDSMEAERESPGDAWDFRSASREARRGSRGTRDSLLQAAINRTETWIRSRVIAATNTGERNVHQQMADIVDRVLKTSETANASEADIAHLKGELLALKSRSQDFVDLGLMSSVNAERFVALLGNANAGSFQVAYHVVRSYLESISTRLDALESVQGVISLFVDTTNEFLWDKEMHLDIREGIAIVTSDGTKLKPQDLSSGEKQLLLLFCNTVTARENASIYLIDEPELSLNVRWQRKLPDRLLRFADGSATQFVLATHSLEMLSQKSEYVVELTPVGT